MKHDTPALDIREADRVKNTEAFRQCFGVVTNSVLIEKVLDIRYGLGGWCEAAKDHQAVWVGFEADSQTFRLAATPKNLWQLHNRTFHQHVELAGECDLLCADFNNLTLRNRHADEFMAAVLKTMPKAIIFTDVACSKLHLNFKSYGLNSADLTQYFEAWQKKLWAFRMLHLARTHHHAATTAWIRRDL